MRLQSCLSTRQGHLVDTAKPIHLPYVFLLLQGAQGSCVPSRLPCFVRCAADMGCSDSSTPKQTLHDRKQDKCRALCWTDADRQGHRAVKVWSGCVSSVCACTPMYSSCWQA